MTRHILATMTAAAALTLAGCGGGNDTATTNTTVQTTTMNDTAMTADMAAPMTPAATFANAAASSDAFEIESSRLAATNASAQSVKDFANRMVSAHTDSTAKLKAAAASASPAINPDPTLTADQQAKLDAMRGAKGADFDRLYIAAQQTGHQQTLDMLRAYAASGDVPALKSLAGELAPKVAAHLNMAKGLKA